MKIWLIVLMLFSQVVTGFEYSDEEITNMEEGLRRWKELAAHPETIPEAERLEKLALGLRKTTRKDIYAFGDAEGAHEQLKSSLLSMGGYADYFANRLRAVRKEAKEGGPGTINLLEEAQLTCFQTLGMLPSAESVRVLGEFLSDEEERVPPSPPGQRDDRNSRQMEMGVNFNAFYSLSAFAKLPLVSPPVPRRRFDHVDYDEDIEAWRLWYEQVKSGKRTFRFEGDPNEYSLAGPVTKAAEPVVSRPESKGANTPSQEAIGKPSKLPVSALVGAIALLIAAIGVAMRVKRSSSVGG